MGGRPGSSDDVALRSELLLRMLRRIHPTFEWRIAHDFEREQIWLKCRVFDHDGCKQGVIAQFSEEDAVRITGSARLMVCLANEIVLLRQPVAPGYTYPRHMVELRDDRDTLDPILYFMPGSSTP